jgi:hypothetical protein
MWSFAMCCSPSLKSGSFAGLFIVSAAVVSAGAGFAQSAPSGGSDAAYLDALGSMVVSMDLDGLAGQTFEAESVVAPTLSTMTASGDAVMDECAVVLVRSEENGNPVEIFGADAALSEQQRAALHKCLMPETGAVVSYLALDN